MNENRTPETTSTMERRARRSESSIWAELLADSGAWRPQDKPRESEGWLRAHGYLPDRRQGA